MNVTNAYGLPSPYVRAVSQFRERNDRQVSVTELLKPGQMTALERKHWDEITVDASDRIEIWWGNAAHAYLAQFAGPEVMAEKRMSYRIGDWLIGGTPDYFDLLGLDAGELWDWKTTRVRALKYDRPEWEAQTNLYAHLLRLNGYEVTALAVKAVLRDWDKQQLGKDETYPRAPICHIDIPLWDVPFAHEFLTGRLGVHEMAAGGYYEPCTDEERWIRKSYAVVKAKNERATRVFSTRKEAEEFADAVTEYPRRWQDWYAIDTRISEPVRCLSYCPVAAFCGQHAAYLQEKADAQGLFALGESLPPLHLVPRDEIR